MFRLGQSPANEAAEKLLVPSGKWLDSNFRKRGQSLLVLESPKEVQPLQSCSVLFCATTIKLGRKNVTGACVVDVISRPVLRSSGIQSGHGSQI